jgi:hypothetical protein
MSSAAKGGIHLDLRGVLGGASVAAGFFAASQNAVARNLTSERPQFTEIGIVRNTQQATGISWMFAAKYKPVTAGRVAAERHLPSAVPFM